MEARFQRTITTSNSVGDVSSSGSVTSAVSHESSPTGSSVRNVNERATTPMLDSGKGIGTERVQSPAPGSVSADSSMGRINPFELAPIQLSPRSLGSNSSHSVHTSSMENSASPASPDRSSNSNAPSASNISSPAPTNNVSSSSQVSIGRQGVRNDMSEGDDDTEPSSAVTSAQDRASTDGQDTLDSDINNQQNSISRFIMNTRKKIGNPRKDDPAEPIADVDDELLGDNTPGTLICGYLQKLGRNGKWQTRWFETDGECLSYYKNEKRTTLLATLDLEKVGSIVIDSEDTEGVSFHIQVLGRLYHLKANSKASCKDWVITLNRVKEARMQQGNVKLVNLSFQPPVDLLDTPAQTDDLVAPRVVVMANRHRTRAVEEEHELNRLIHLEENVGQGQELVYRQKSEKRISAIGTVVLGRWTKRRSSLSRLRSKFTKWARSVTSLTCKSDSAVALDRHVHPPGHDDRTIKDGLPSGTTKVTGQTRMEGSNWIAKETSMPIRSTAAPGQNRARKMSTASDSDVRVLS